MRGKLLATPLVAALAAGLSGCKGGSGESYKIDDPNQVIVKVEGMT